MRLIHNDIADIHLLHIALEKSGSQTLRRHIKKLEVAIQGIVQCIIDFSAPHAGIYTQGLDTTVSKVLHLILHQGDQRCHHYGHARTYHRRHLEAYGFSASGRQDCKHVPAFQSSPDYVLLLWPERVVTPIFIQDFKSPVAAVFTHILSILSFSNEKACIMQQM